MSHLQRKPLMMPVSCKKKSKKTLFFKKKTLYLFQISFFDILTFLSSPTLGQPLLPEYSLCPLPAEVCLINKLNDIHNHLKKHCTMNNENKTQFTTDQLRSSLKTGTALADLHATCAALEQLSAQILTTSAPENVSRKREAIERITFRLKSIVIDLVDTCIGYDKDLVLGVSKATKATDSSKTDSNQ